MSLIKMNEMFGFLGVFSEGRFCNTIMVSVCYVFLYSCFKGSTGLSDIWSTTWARNFVNTWLLEGVDFVFHWDERLFESLEWFKGNFDVLFNENLSNLISGSLDKGKKSSRNRGLGVKMGFRKRMFRFVKRFLDLGGGIAIVLKGMF